MLKVERRWIADDLPEYELLEALAHAYGVLSILINDAHLQAGVSGTQIHVRAPNGRYKPIETPINHLEGQLPCMVASADTRTVWIKLSTKESVTPISSIVALTNNVIKEAEDRYGLLFKESLNRIRKPLNLNELSELILERAKNILFIDGYHITLIFYLLQDRYDIFNGTQTTRSF